MHFIIQHGVAWYIVPMTAGFDLLSLSALFVSPCALNFMNMPEYCNCLYIVTLYI